MKQPAFWSPSESMYLVCWAIRRRSSSVSDFGFGPSDIHGKLTPSALFRTLVTVLDRVSGKDKVELSEILSSPPFW